jgi:hypothetical protein
MSITPKECELAIAAMKPDEEIHFLAVLGHWLTVVARGTYEFQAPGVNDPITLRYFNEIHHRLYAQIRSLSMNGKGGLDAEDMTSWLVGEGRPEEFQAGCLWAFEQSLRHVHGGT